MDNIGAMNSIGIDDQTIEAIRLAGVGWIFAFFFVGATILAGRWLVSWQMRRLGIMAPKPEDGDTPGSETSDGGTGEPPRG
jgi:hypothetical protein